MEHHGVVFTDEYVPHGIPITYKGKVRTRRAVGTINPVWSSIASTARMQICLRLTGL